MEEVKQLIQSHTQLSTSSFGKWKIHQNSIHTHIPWSFILFRRVWKHVFRMLMVTLIPLRWRQSWSSSYHSVKSWSLNSNTELIFLPFPESQKDDENMTKIIDRWYLHNFWHTINIIGWIPITMGWSPTMNLSRVSKVLGTLISTGAHCFTQLKHPDLPI